MRLTLAVKAFLLVGCAGVATTTPTSSERAECQGAGAVLSKSRNRRYLTALPSYLGPEFQTVRIVGLVPTRVLAYTKLLPAFRSRSSSVLNAPRSPTRGRAGVYGRRPGDGGVRGVRSRCARSQCKGVVRPTCEVPK